MTPDSWNETLAKPALAGRRIVVTGGAGFIGSALTEALLHSGAEVVCLDDFRTGKRENIEPFRGNPAWILAEGDICDKAVVTRACKGANAILHEAALGSVPRSLEQPAEVFRVNVSGFASIFHAAAQAGVKRFIYASSSSVYGDSPVLPKREAETGKALSPYALTKQVCEQMAAFFSKLYGMETLGLRYFNVYGRRQDESTPYAAVIPKFISALLARRSPVINGSGAISRDFTFVEDVVNANLLALTLPALPEPATVCNIASGHETTLDELTGILREALSLRDAAIASIPTQYGPPRAHDIPHSLADISRAGSLLGYQPRFDIRAGLEKTVSYYENRSAASGRIPEARP